MDKLAATGIIYRIFSSRLFISVSICLKCHEVVATKSFHLVNILTGQLDSQRIFVLCEARILWYSADRTSSRALRDTTSIRIWELSRGISPEEIICVDSIGLVPKF